MQKAKKVGRTKMGKQRCSGRRSSRLLSALGSQRLALCFIFIILIKNNAQ